MNHLAKEIALPNGSDAGRVVAPQLGSPTSVELRKRDHAESLFERFAWLYIFCREKLFRDDTERIITVLWADGAPKKNARLIELGCGPGFYSCRLAARFPQLSVLGVDRSAKQLAWAQEKVRINGLRNCSFERVNVLASLHASDSFEFLVASRLLTIIPEREKAVAEMFRVLREGGRCFVAEPRYSFWASVPLLALWMLASLTRNENGYCEPRKASVLSQVAFRKLFSTQPWKSVNTWQDGRYQYALCEKG